MANSKYEYVRSFEQPDNLLPNTFIVVRIDGRGFTKLTTKYKFVKPNDQRALDLMNASAEAVMRELPDLVLAYGQSDEYSFVFHKDCTLFERRASKLTTTIVSTFTANYVHGWSKYFAETPLTPPLPSFDGRAVCYPSDANLRDYLSWRQVDCHINNLYNTTFWALVQKGNMDPREAEQELSGTLSSDKNQILFSRFGINYNNEPPIFKKGSVLYRDFFPTSTQSSPTFSKTTKPSPPLSHPRPQRPLARPMSQPLERTPYTDLLRDSPTPRGPTFLSTSTTPSPPPSPPSMSIPTFANPLPDRELTSYPQTFTPVFPAPPNGSSRQPLPLLTPLPLPPPTLKPSTRPPPSLNPPNPTAYTNTSPLPSPNATNPNPIPRRTTSNPKQTPPNHSHSVSPPLTRPTTASVPQKLGPKRSPSMSILEFGPPPIPLRISSIPINAQPRKLSLPSQKSYSMLRAEEKENLLAGPYTSSGVLKPSPPLPTPLRIDKELPSTPVDDIATRNAVMGSEPQSWSTSPPPTRQDRRAEVDRTAQHSIIPYSQALPVQAPPQKQRARSHSRLHSAPVRMTENLMPLGSNPVYIPTGAMEKERSRFAHFDWNPAPSNAPPKSDSKSQSKPKKDKESKKGKGKAVEEGGWAAGAAANEGRPVQSSKTQKDKERKKKTKARVVIEHVDIIKDEFWERRPWILSGRTG